MDDSHNIMTKTHHCSLLKQSRKRIAFENNCREVLLFSWDELFQGDRLLHEG